MWGAPVSACENTYTENHRTPCRGAPTPAVLLDGILSFRLRVYGGPPLAPSASAFSRLLQNPNSSCSPAPKGTSTFCAVGEPLFTAAAVLLQLLSSCVFDGIIVAKSIPSHKA